MYILVADECRVRVVVASTNIIISIAGTGTCQTTSATGVQVATSFNLNSGFGLCVDSAGSIFYGDYYAGYVRKISSTSLDGGLRITGKSLYSFFTYDTKLGFFSNIAFRLYRFREYKLILAQLFYLPFCLVLFAGLL
eukprot:gene14987-16689_t